ncbi:MAG: lipopolysaccharide biosynthesis protein [Acidimicrobiia bacterium]
MTQDTSTNSPTTPSAHQATMAVRQSDETSSSPAISGLTRGLRWSAGNIAIGRAFSMVSSIVLARILAPEVFGVFAVTLVVLTGLVSLNDLGATNAIVRWPGSPDRAARTATTLAWAMSLIGGALAIASAPLLAQWSAAPEATLPIQVLALGVLLDGIAAVPGALLTRGFHQDRRARADIASLLTSIAVSIGLALAGFGIWALVFGRLAGNAVAAIGVIIVAPSRPRPGWNGDDARALLRFGLPLVGASALVFVMANADTLVIARTLGAGAALGFYVMAFNLSSWPLNVLSGTLRRVSLPTFARHQESPDRLGNSVLGTIQLVSAIAALPCMLLSALAPWIIASVYGAKWTPAAAPLVFLALLGWVRVLTELGWDALIATGRTPRVLLLQAGWTLTLIPTLIVGTRMDGIRGAAIAHAGIAMLIVVPAFAWAMHRLGAHIIALLRRTLRPVATAVVIGGATYLAAHHLALRPVAVVLIVAPVSTLVFAAVVVRPRSLRSAWHDIVGGEDQPR